MSNIDFPNTPTSGDTYSFDGKQWTFDGQPGTGSGDKTHIEKAEGYIAHKWGMASLLPNSHPYKNSAPSS